jgi:hypothetical protein
MQVKQIKTGEIERNEGVFKGEIAKARDLVLSIEPGSGATQGRLCPSLCFHM